MAGNFWQSSHYEQWMFDKAELQRMRFEDLKIYSDEEYGKLMIFFCNLIQQIALESHQQPNIKTRMQVIATACTYFKRFYVRRTLKDIDPFLLAPTCIYLASKVEEFGMMSTNKLTVAVGAALKKWPYVNPETTQRVGIIHEVEFIMLEIMDCCLIVFHPFRPLTLTLQDIKANCQIKDFDEFETTCWRICNDTVRGDFTLLYSPHVTTLACVVEAAMLLNKEKEIQAYLSDINIDFDKVQEAMSDINSLYVLWKSFDEQKQLQPLLDKLPRPSTTPTQPATMQQPIQQPSQPPVRYELSQQQMQQQQPPPPPQPQMVLSQAQHAAPPMAMQAMPPQAMGMPPMMGAPPAHMMGHPGHHGMTAMGMGPAGMGHHPQMAPQPMHQIQMHPQWGPPHGYQQ